jgi:hypothetical protein
VDRFCGSGSEGSSARAFRSRRSDAQLIGLCFPSRRDSAGDPLHRRDRPRAADSQAAAICARDPRRMQ